MSREELIELLREYKENKAKLNIKLKALKTARMNLKACDEIETSLTAGYGINQDIHSKNKISDKVLKRIEQNDKNRISLQEEIKKLEETVRSLREKVESIEDRLECLKHKEKETLIAYHIEGRTYNDIGTNLYWSLFNQTRDGETIKKIVEKAIGKMLKL